MEVSLKTISKTLLIVGTTCFIVRVDLGLAKPTEYFFSIAVLMGTLYFVITPKWRKVNGLIVTLIAMVVFAVLLGTLWGAFAYGLEFSVGGVRLLLKLFLNVWTFLVLLVWLEEDQTFFRRMALAMSVPYVVYALAWFLPDQWKMQLLNEPDLQLGRFQGISDAVGSMAFPLVEAFAFAYVLWLKESNKATTKWWFMVVTGVVLLFELWSASRICMLALITCAFVGMALVARSGERRYMAAMAVGGRSMALLAVPIVVGLQMGALNFLEIAVIRVTGASLDQEDLSGMAMNAINLLTDPSINVRLSSYDYYKDLVLSNQLGLGVNYFERLAYEVNGAKLPPDSFLDTMMHGGVLLAAAMSILVFIALRSAVRKMQRNGVELRNADSLPYLIGAATALVANLVFTAFGGFPIYSLRFWIILAMCMAYKQNNSHLVREG